MHYCTLLFTKGFPSRDDISNIMSKYNYDNLDYDDDGNLVGEHPLFTWDWYRIGGRYNGSIKLKINPEDKTYNWGFYYDGGRNCKLFHSNLLYKMKDSTKNSFLFSEEDYYGSMGYNDGYIYVDGAKVEDVLNMNEQDCFICIDEKGTAIARESWNGDTFVKDEEFDKKFEQIKNNSKNLYLTVLDIHD